MARKPRILRIINRLNLGGPTHNVALLTKHLEADYETLLVSGSKDKSEASSEHIVHQLGLSPVYIPEMRRELNFFNDRKAYLKIKKLIQDFKPDIVHTHASKSGALGRLAAHHSKVPVILHTFHGHVFHSYFSTFKSMSFLKIERYLAKKSTRVIAISKTQKEELGTQFKVCHPDKIEVIPLGFDLTRFQENQVEKRKQFREKYGLQADEIAIGIVGRLVPIKNHTLFLKIIKSVIEQTPKKVKAVIIGDGEERETIENECRNLNMETSTDENPNPSATIIFTSWIKDVDRAYAGLDIVTLTSLNEGTPVSLIEAQASDKPIVSTEVGGIRDVVIPGETAFLTRRKDIKKFAEQLLKLVENAPLRSKMSKKGYEFVKEKFNHQRLAGDMDLLYRKLLADSGSENC
jgi:glycosyltransferase involved in cell wall biosynthesis